MNEPIEILEAFNAVAELGLALGAAPLNQHPGCWECSIDEQWKVAVNGHDEPMKCSLSNIPIEPFHCYVEYNGWPAGILNPRNGVIAAGSCANEDTFMAAVRARIAKAKEAA